MANINARNLGAVYKPTSASNTKITTTTTTTYVPPTYKTTYQPGFSQSYYTPASYVYIPPVKYYSNTVVVAGGTNLYSGSGFINARGYVTYYSNTSSYNLGGLIGGVIGGVLFLLFICICVYYLWCRDKYEEYQME